MGRSGARTPAHRMAHRLLAVGRMNLAVSKLTTPATLALALSALASGCAPAPDRGNAVAGLSLTPIPLPIPARQVTTAGELAQALSDNYPEIQVPDDAQINLKGSPPLVIKGNTHLYGGRDRLVDGGLIYNDDRNAGHEMFLT